MITRFLSLIALLTCLVSDTAGIDRPRPPRHEFSFVVLGDSQFEGPNAYNRLIDEVVRLFPSFVIQVGDMIQFPADSTVVRAKWKRFKAQIAPLGEIPFYPVPGNHDVLDSSRAPGGEPVYREVWGETYYSFDYRNAHFVVLNTDEGVTSEIVGEQWTWLVKDLREAAGKDHIFVFFHRPIYSLANEEALHAIFVKHKVSAVFYGHHHHLNFHERDGITYLMTTSSTEARNPYGERSGVFHHQLLVTVRNDEASIAVIRANSVLPPDIVSVEDNSDLHNLHRKFFTRVESRFSDLPRDGNRYTVTLSVNNPSGQDLVAFFEWELPNNRWAVEHSRGVRVELPAGTRDLSVTFTLKRKYPSAPEAYPSCIARAHYLTHDGDVVETKHRFTILGPATEENP